MTDSTLSTFTASDGDNLAIQDWPLPDGLPVRGVVVLVHGLGEHAGRYDHVASFLNRRGFAVRGYDQYGHGESGGARGTLTSPDRLLDDLADVIEAVRMRVSARLPLLLLGHSMGGVVAARYVAQHPKAVNGLILSSPALQLGLGPVQKLLLRVLPRWCPNLQMGNGLDAAHLSHDPEVVTAYREDYLVHDRISPRLARFMADAGATVLERATRWKVPTLLMYAGADRLVNPQGSLRFSRAAPAAVVETRCFDQLYHEIFNEPERDEVLRTMGHWIDRRF